VSRPLKRLRKVGAEPVLAVRPLLHTFIWHAHCKLALSYWWRVRRAHAAHANVSFWYGLQAPAATYELEDDLGEGAAAAGASSHKVRRARRCRAGWPVLLPCSSPACAASVCLSMIATVPTGQRPQPRPYRARRRGLCTAPSRPALEQAGRLKARPA
jgi:hypothetical protein